MLNFQGVFPRNFYRDMFVDSWVCWSEISRFFSQSLEEEGVNEALISYKFPGYKIDIFLLKHSILQYT